MEKPLKISLLIISPVHVGCDDVYEPTGFVIDEKRKKLIAFDSLEFIKSLSDNESKEFTDLCIQGDITSIPKLYNFISSKKIAGKEIDIANGLTDNYRKVKALVKSKDEKKIGQELNQFAISRTVYNPHNNLPYIPGSSLKGALRNAYLNKLVSDQGISKCWNKYLQEKDRANDHIIYNAIGKKAVARRFENDLLDGNFATDPFRLVKVSDFLPTGVVNTKIMYAVNKKKMATKFARRSGIPQILEVIQPGAVFEGTISIFEPLPKAGIRRAVTEEDLFTSLNDFYGEAFDVEYTMMKGIGADCGIYVKLKDDYKDILDTKGFLIRAGRHSGAEAVTIEGNRMIKIMQGGGKPLKYQEVANTIWLASETNNPTYNTDLLPFGWMLLSTVPLQSVMPAKSISRELHPDVQKQEVEAKPIDKFIAAIRGIQPADAERIGSIIDTALVQLDSDDEKRIFTQTVKDHLGSAFKKSKAEIKLKPFLGK